MTVIIDYGIGNLRSILMKFHRLEIDAIISRAPEDIVNADRLVLPGVGHFGTGMKNLNDYGLIPVLEEAVLRRKTPMLGICLGFQLLSHQSEEGDTRGLGWIDAVTKKFTFEKETKDLRVPHVGWNSLTRKQDSPLLTDIGQDDRFYFTHSYYVQSENPDNVIATTEYGTPFTSLIRQDNIYGTQFHPEKSHRQGLALITNFARLA